MTQPSETPRTDIRKFRKGDLYDPSTKAGTLYVSSETEFVEAWFCAAIERELSTARSILADLERQFGKLLAQPKAAPQTRPLEPLQQLGIDREREREASAAPDSGMPDQWVWWNKGDGFAVGPRNVGAIAIVFTVEEAQAICSHVNSALSLREREGMVPTWTVLFNDGNGRHRLLAFCSTEEAADNLYMILSNHARVPTKRPFHKNDPALAAAPSAGGEKP